MYRVLVARLFYIILLGVCCTYSLAYAVDMTSTSFIVRDPIVGTGSQYSDSSSFKLFSAGNTILSGTGSSATYIGRYGSLYYPYVIQGVFSATPSGSQVDLSWGVSSAGQGLNVSGYKIGKSSVDGGPYTYTDVGNVSIYSYTNQSPGVYYFILQTLDTFGNVIATSAQVTATVTQSISFSINDNTVGFGNLSSSGARFATPDGVGAGSVQTATVLDVATNASQGYSVNYTGPTLSSVSDTVPGATITSDIDGTPGTKQFAIAVSTNGSATISTPYQYTSSNWSYIPNNQTVLAVQNSASTESLSTYYLANITPATNAGSYSSIITYTMSANF